MSDLVVLFPAPVRCFHLTATVLSGEKTPDKRKVKKIPTVS